MKILQIIPGSGGSFYCGNCLRDDKFYEALRKQGHDVLKLPMYLPLFSDEHDITDVPVFYGAVSLYLKQQYPFLRKAPKWFDKLLNSKPMLKLAANQSGSTNPEGLEDMTISMLLGEDGGQSEELDEMVKWIAHNYKPDVIHISNALLLGLARKLKKNIKVPVVCSLQDEDVWVDGMKPKFRDKVWKLMSDKAEDVDAFIAVSEYYANVSKNRMKLCDEKMNVVHLGVNPDNYTYIHPTEKKRNIGFISRMNHENGLDILVDAFVMLKKDKQFDDVTLIITGGSTGVDKKFIAKQIKKLNSAGLKESYKILKDFEGEARDKFFEQVSLISVPVRNGEAFGIYLTESMGSGIPVIQPNIGAFPEIIEAGGGGIVYPENTPESLESSLTKVFSDKGYHEKLALEARKSVEENFNINNQAEKMIQVYKAISGTH